MTTEALQHEANAQRTVTVQVSAESEEAHEARTQIAAVGVGAVLEREAQATDEQFAPEIAFAQVIVPQQLAVEENVSAATIVEAGQLITEPIQLEGESTAAHNVVVKETVPVDLRLAVAAVTMSRDNEVLDAPMDAASEVDTIWPTQEVKATVDDPEAIVFVEPLLAPKPNVLRMQRETEELRTIDDLLVYIGNVAQLADEQDEDEPGIVQVLADGQEAADRVVSVLWPLDESLQTLGHEVITQEDIDTTIDWRIEELMSDVKLAELSADEFMERLTGLEKEVEPELRELLAIVADLLDELEVEKPTALQLVNLVKSLILHMARQRATQAITLDEPQVWTRDISIARERYGLFGVWPQLSTGSGDHPTPLGRFALKVLLAA